jgi:hypothetical protein
MPVYDIHQRSLSADNGLAHREASFATVCLRVQPYAVHSLLRADDMLIRAPLPFLRSGTKQQRSFPLRFPC